MFFSNFLTKFLLKKRKKSEKNEKKFPRRPGSLTRSPAQLSRIFFSKKKNEIFYTCADNIAKVIASCHVLAERYVCVDPNTYQFQRGDIFFQLSILELDSPLRLSDCQ